MKQCISCNNIKDDALFDSGSNQCKDCRRAAQRTIDKSKEGVIKRIYNEQLKNSRKRSHPAPSYTSADLVEFVVSHDTYENMYSQWVDSGYNRKHRPSIDRVDALLPYTMDNIELTTWDINIKRAHTDMRQDKLKTGFNKVAVEQYTLDGLFVAGYISQLEAARATGINNTDISKAILGVSMQAGGFQWIVATQSSTKSIKKMIAGKHTSVIKCDASTGEEIEQFNSIVIAAASTGIHKANISACIRGVYRTAGGYVWKKISQKDDE